MTERRKYEREMSDKEEGTSTKRAHETENQEGDGNESDDGWIGPMPTDAVPTKKRKGKPRLF